MKKNRLGKAGIEVSALSFGASALGGVFHQVDEAEGIRAVEAAMEAGINYFDVAPAYGATRSEQVLGKALQGVSRERYFLSTKAGKYTNPGAYGEDLFDYTEAGMRRGLEASMERLGVDYLDIVHLHDFEYQRLAHVEAAFSEGFPALARFKAEGWIGAVSAGIYPLDLWKRVIEEAPVDAILMHNHYCLNDTRGLELVPLCREKNIGIINASPFSSGLLTGGAIADWHPADQADRGIFAEAARFCEERGTTIAKLAFQFASQQPHFPTTMFSTSRTSSVARNIEWFQEPYDPELLAGVQRILEPVMNKQWDYDAGVERMKE